MPKTNKNTYIKNICSQYLNNCNQNSGQNREIRTVGDLDIYGDYMPCSYQDTLDSIFKYCEEKKNRCSNEATVLQCFNI